METKFSVTKEERKALVAALGELTGREKKYLGAPTFAFAVGDYVVERDGRLLCGSEMADALPGLLNALAARGFVREEPDVSANEPEPDGDSELLGIELPDEGFTAAAFDNLVKLVNGKAPLIRASLGEQADEGAEELPISREDGKIRFPWFRLDMAQEERAAWLRFIAALCETAKKQKRVVPRDAESGLSEREAFRCFLLRLGFIGGEYKEARKLLLAPMSGNGKKAPAQESEAVQV
jgi:hypothetical protein